MGNTAKKLNRIIFFPAYGTDKSIYEGIKVEKFPNCEILKLDFDTPKIEDSLEDYANYYVRKLNISHEDILIGTSFGGVLAIEINKIVSTKKTIIISSIKNTKEKPFLFQLISSFNLFPLARPQVMKFGLDVIAPLYGKNVKEFKWFRKVFKASDPIFLEWALREIVLWKNDFVPDELIHIHGTLDPLFPSYKLRNVEHIIKGGNHAMIRLKCSLISELLKNEIDECLAKPLFSN